MTYTCPNPDCDNFETVWECEPKEHFCPECGEEAEEVEA
jgi:peptide subunit release factor 1 (eRF1)